MAQTAFAIAAALIALALAMATFDRYLSRHRPHELAWSIAFIAFAIASVALALGSQHGWTGPLFRLFYLFGAIINVPILALGSLLLANQQRPVRQRIYIYTVAAFCIFSAGVMVATPLLAPLPTQTLAKGSEVLGTLPRLLAAVGSGLSATIIIVLAIRSAVRRYGRNLVIGNGLIALGTAITGMSGLLNSVLGEMEAFSVTLMIGIAVIFIGFLFATSSSRPQKTLA